MAAGWEFWIDRGGTFTDVVALGPGGERIVEKLLSVDPEHYDDATLEAIRRVLARHGGAAPVSAVKMGTTLATNALLERQGEPTVLAITAGFADALIIGHQARPSLFARHIVRPEPVAGRTIEVTERVTAEGTVVEPLDEAALRRDLEAAYADGFRAVAIVLMHGWQFHAHEARVAEIARAVGFTEVSASHAVAPLIKLIARGDTTVANAYLSPVLMRYVSKLTHALGSQTRLLFMQSNGGLCEAGAVLGKDAVLSGPAGGVVGMVAAGTAAGFNALIGFDMGGTSTDVSHYAGTFERASETVVSGLHLTAPMLEVHTVAAGGGSICWFDGARLRVGPRSAGAHPGPACYRNGGPLTVTDCNVVLGKILPDRFPHVFGPDADAPLDAAAATARIEAIADDIARATGTRPLLRALAEGFVAIAVETMAGAIKRISSERGYDPAEYTLMCFGGAGGQHACRVADALGLARIVIHPLAGVLSAYGVGLAPLRALKEETVRLALGAAQWPAIETHARALERAARAALEDQGIALRSVHVAPFARCKYQGADTTLAVPLGATATELRAGFEAAHQRQFGFASPDEIVIVEALSVDATGEPARPEAAAAKTQAASPGACEERSMRSGGCDWVTPVFARDALAPNITVEGPAILCEATATTIVEPGWQARVDAEANLILERVAPLSMAARDETAVDPVQLELFNNRFMAVAEQMGAVLQNTAFSVNIKERLDYSCAVFDGAGALIANAPHIPVHLGSMGDSVRALIAARGPDGLHAGDVYMTNAPYRGGTHLPDITVIAPVCLGPGERPSFFVAARGHHADIGGITPGSMPPHSRAITEEGVLIEDFLLVTEGRLREAEARALFASGPHPARNPDQNIADLKAQIAACVAGAAELTAMAGRYGRALVEAYMAHVQANAAESVRRVIDHLSDGAFVCPMDNGAQIHVAIRVDRARRSVEIDFSGTSAQRDDNFNAPPSIARAAVLYVFRTLIDDAIPLNEGCLRPVTLIIPEGSMLNPRYPAAVVAGNVETSQTIVDALYGALGVMAAAQGTMNNFSFGDAAFQYYETICGGAGAGPDFDGASAVQTHMTNSRLTDPEILESRFPVLVERFAIRRGSGGAGRNHGGDGVVRALCFRQAATAAILSGRRTTAPFGLEGGAPGQPGCNSLVRADGTAEQLGAVAEVKVAPGDRIIIETPGGGGFGQL